MNAKRLGEKTMTKKTLMCLFVAMLALTVVPGAFAQTTAPTE
jgi:hypothetical protein